MITAIWRFKKKKKKRNWCNKSTYVVLKRVKQVGGKYKNVSAYALPQRYLSHFTPRTRTIGPYRNNGYCQVTRLKVSGWKKNWTAAKSIGRHYAWSEIRTRIGLLSLCLCPSVWAIWECERGLRIRKWHRA